MSQKYFKLLFKLLVIITAFSVCYSKFDSQRQNVSLLFNFVCTLAKNELEKHPEMRTIAMVELETNFPSEFSRELLKCLPNDVAKIILNPHTNIKKTMMMMLPKETMVIYIADKMDWDDSVFFSFLYFEKNFPVINHLSKHLIISNKYKKIDHAQNILYKLSSVIQIYEENQKVIKRSLEKRSQSKKLYAVWSKGMDAQYIEGSDRPNHHWTYFLDIITEKLNATLEFIEIKPDKSTEVTYSKELHRLMQEFIDGGKLDFYLDFDNEKLDLESYNNEEWCFLAPLPPKFSITELILFLPMDKSCWMWLGITIAVSSLVWRISEGHWNFPFGAFSYFMGQAQLTIRIRTNRLMMKILLQLLILTFFIFSSGYQSLVTSFMLNPVEEKLLKSVDDVLESNLNIDADKWFDELQSDNLKYQEAKRNGRVSEFDVTGLEWKTKMTERHLARIQPCKSMKMIIDYWGDGKSWEEIYQVPEVVLTKPDDLYTRPFHPLIDKIQKIMDQSFEVGLPGAWWRFYWEVWKEKFGKKNQKWEVKEVLDFGLIIPFFLILAFGFSIALVTLLFEIFWHDFVMELTSEYFERKWHEIFRRRVNIVQVRRNEFEPMQINLNV